MTRKGKPKKPSRPWWGEVLRIVGYAVVAVIIDALVMRGWAEQVLGVHRGRIVDDAGASLHGALLLFFTGMLFPAIFLSFRRADLGYRSRGFWAVFFPGAAFVSLVVALSTLLWPAVIGYVPGSSIYYSWGSGPLIVAIAAAYVWGAAMLALLMGFILQAMPYGECLTRLVGFAVAMVVLVLMVSTLPLLDLPVEQAPLVLAVLVAAGFVLAIPVAVIMGVREMKHRRGVRRATLGRHR